MNDREKWELPDYNVSERRNNRMRTLLLELIKEDPEVDKDNNIKSDKLENAKLASNYIEAVEASYLKIKEYNLRRYNYKLPSSEYSEEERIFSRSE